MELQTAFYILGIIFMAVNLILIFALLSAVLVIKSKISKVHDEIEDKMNQIKRVGSQAGMVLGVLRHFIKH